IPKDSRAAAMASKAKKTARKARTPVAKPAAKSRTQAKVVKAKPRRRARPTEHTSELQSLIRIPYADFRLQTKTRTQKHTHKIANTTPHHNNTQLTSNHY